MTEHSRLRIGTGPQCASARPVATRHEREHARTAATLLPEGSRPVACSADDLDAIAKEFNARPRKALGWKTPAETLGAVPRSARSGAATIGLNQAASFRRFMRAPLTVRGLAGPMSWHGNPYDNEKAGSIMGAPKAEAVCSAFNTKMQAESPSKLGVLFSDGH